MPSFLGFVYIAQYTSGVFDKYLAKYSQNNSFANRYGFLVTKQAQTGRNTTVL